MGMKSLVSLLVLLAAVFVLVPNDINAIETYTYPSNRPGAKCFNKVNANQPKGTDFFSRHHVIPYNLIKTVVEKALKTDNNSEKAAKFVEEVFDILSKYNTNVKVVLSTGGSNYGELLPRRNIPANDITLSLLSTSLANNIRQKGFRNLKSAAELLASAITWIPANLFVGPKPSLRANDPKNDFDAEAKFLLDQELYLNLYDLNRQMTNFVKSTSSHAFQRDNMVDSIFAQLIQLSKARNDAEPFDWCKWFVKNGLWSPNLEQLTTTPAPTAAAAPNRRQPPVNNRPVNNRQPPVNNRQPPSNSKRTPHTG